MEVIGIGEYCLSAKFLHLLGCNGLYRRFCADNNKSRGFDLSMWSMDYPGAAKRARTKLFGYGKAEFPHDFGLYPHTYFPTSKNVRSPYPAAKPRGILTSTSKCAGIPQPEKEKIRLRRIMLLFFFDNILCAPLYIKTSDLIINVHTEAI